MRLGNVLRRGRRGVLSLFRSEDVLGRLPPSELGWWEPSALVRVTLPARWVGRATRGAVCFSMIDVKFPGSCHHNQSGSQRHPLVDESGEGFAREYLGLRHESVLTLW